MNTRVFLFQYIIEMSVIYEFKKENNNMHHFNNYSMDLKKDFLGLSGHIIFSSTGASLGVFLLLWIG